MIADPGDETGGLDLPGERLGGCEIEGERFFHEEREMPGQGRPLGHAMGEGRHADVDGVERHLGQHGFEIGEGARTEAFCRALCPLLDRIGESRQFDVSELFENAEMAMRDPTRTDEADAGSRCLCAVHSHHPLLGSGRNAQLLKEPGRLVRHAGRREGVEKTGLTLEPERASVIGVAENLADRGRESVRVTWAD